MNLNDRKALYTRVLGDGRVIDVFPLTFGRARITVSPTEESKTFDDGF